MAGSGGSKRKAGAIVRGIQLHHGKYRWRKLVDGKRLIVPLLATTADEAIAEVLALRAQPLAAVTGEWEPLVDAYLRTVSAGTRDSRGPVLKAIGREMHLRTPRSLTPAVANRWLARLEARAMPTKETPEPEITTGTVLHYVRDLRAFVKWAVAKRHMPQDPTAGFVLPKVEEKLRDVWVPAKRVGELIEDAKQAGDRDMEWILALGFECFMRRGEIDACRPEWFDLDLAILRIPPSDAKGEPDESDLEDWKRKGRDGRRKEAVIPLSALMLDLIRRHGLPGPYIVAPKKKWGKHRYRFEFRNRFEKFMEVHELGHVTIHDMRRSAASNRVSAGVSIEKVANWMGIHYRTAWKRYARFLPADADINRGSASAPAVEKIPPPSDIATRLAQVEALHAAGLITAEEHTKKRAEIIASL